MGEVRLSLPWYVSKAKGLKYLYSKKDWIKKHYKSRAVQWTDGQIIAKNYKLRLHNHVKKSTKSYKDKDSFNIFLPAGLEEPDRQKSIQNHINKFLKKESERLLIPYVQNLADETDYKVRDIRIKNMKSRWGSCSQDKIITLNQSLITIPAELTEYVIFHELAHTKHLNHSKEFWSEVEKFVPDYKLRRKTLRNLSTNGIF